MSATHAPDTHVPESDTCARLAFPRFARLANLLPAALLAGLCAYCILSTIGHTAALNTTHLYDGWRDAGAAQSMLAGEYPGDPLYKGEWSYYNPLTPGLIALGSCGTGWDVEATSARLGTYLNILAPLAFFVLAAMLFNRWIALAAAVALVFTAVDGRQIGFYFSYIPWLYPSHLGIALFCLTLALLPGAFKKLRITPLLLIGLLWGLTFLAHTAPAVSFGAILWLSVLDHLITRRDLPLRLRLTTGAALGLIPTAVAFTTSLPYTYPILTHYRFHIKNWAPVLYTDPALQLQNLPEFFSGSITGWNLLAICGFILLLLKPRKVLRHRVVLYWILTVAILLLCTILRQLPDPWRLPLPQFVPSHHFVSQFAAIRILLAAYGAVTMLHFLIRKLAPRLAAPAKLRLLLPCLLFSAAVFACYHGRYQDWSEPRLAQIWFQDDPYLAQRDLIRIWLRQHTQPSDVILCQEYFTAQFVMPTGRKAVTTFGFYSNPYVDYPPRADCYINIGNAIVKNDPRRLRDYATRFGVKWLLVYPSDFFCKEAATSPLLTPALSLPPFTIYRIN